MTELKDVHLAKGGRIQVSRLFFGQPLNPEKADWAAMPCYTTLDEGWLDVYHCLYATLVCALCAMMCRMAKRRVRRRVRVEEGMVEEDLEDGSTAVLCRSDAVQEDRAERRVVAAMLWLEFGLALVQAVGVIFSLLKSKKVVSSRLLLFSLKVSSNTGFRLRHARNLSSLFRYWRFSLSSSKFPSTLAFSTPQAPHFGLL